MVIVFFNYSGIVHHEWRNSYQGVLGILTFSVTYVMQFVATDQTLSNTKLDNALAHSSHLIQYFLAKNGIPVVHQAPHSPYKAPRDFWLFPKVKSIPKGTLFDIRYDTIMGTGT